MAQITSLKDKHIMSKSFRLMCSGVDNMTVKDHLNWDLYYNYFTTSVGDNRYINPMPQFSPATDPRYQRFMNSKEGGMGTQFKRVFEDNFSLLTITAGVAEFSGLLSFITTMFNPASAIMANKGRSPSWAFYFMEAVGTIAFWPMQVLSIGLQFLSFLTDSPRNQFYYVKPSMGHYLSGAQNFFNDLMVSLGYINPVLPGSTTTAWETGESLYGLGPMNNKSDQISRLQSMFPNAVDKDGTIDLAVLVSKGSRKYRYMLDELKKLDEMSGDTEDKFDHMQKTMEGLTYSNVSETRGIGTAEYRKLEENSVSKYREESAFGEGSYPEESSAYFRSKAYANVYNPEDGVSSANPGATSALDTSGSVTPGAPPSTSPSDSAQPPSSATPSAGGGAPTVESAEAQNKVNYDSNILDHGWNKEVQSLVKAGWQGGFDAITWRVEHQGAVTDSFSNSATESPMASKFNGMVKSANDFKFDAGGGKTGLPGLDTVISWVTDGITGLASSLSISNIPLALANNAYINIPDHWDSSSASLHKESYRMKFEAPYGHPYCQIMNIWVPFSLLAPLCMPQATGGASHTTPLLVKTFSQSRQIIRTGMVSDATFTWGDGNIGWSRNRRPLTLTVELTVVDLDKMISLPMNRGMSAVDLVNPAAFMSSVLNDTGKYNDWLARLTGVEYLDTVLKWSRLSRQLTMAKSGVEHTFSASNIANTVNDSILGDLGKLFARPMKR